MIANLKQRGQNKVITPLQPIKRQVIDHVHYNLGKCVPTQMSVNKCNVVNKLKILNLTVTPKYNNVNRVNVKNMDNVTQTPKTILGICHIGSVNIFIKMEKYINNLLNINKAYANYSITIIAALINSLPVGFINHVKLKYPQIIFIETPNAGFDIGSFFNILKYCKDNNLEFDYIIKVHTKTNDKWRNSMLTSLVGSTNCIHNILKIFEDPSIGLICDGTINCMNNGTPTNNNYAHLKYLIEKYNINISPNTNVRFAGGTMFWVRYSILKKIFWECDFNNILEEFNSVDTFDWNWYKCANRHKFKERDINAMINKDIAHTHYFQYGKSNNLSPNLFHAINYNTQSTKLRDAMIEHAYERLFSYMVISLKFKQYFINNEISL